MPARLRKPVILSVAALLLVVMIPGISGCGSSQKTAMPLVLLTDYGTDSYWVPQLKGVIYNTCPTANVIDATHDIPPFDVPTGAFILQMAAREFPEGFTFVVIVAPGDSSSDRYLALTTAKNQIFLLPDNGVLTYVIRDSAIETLYQITNDSLFTRPVKELFSTQLLGQAGGLVAAGHRTDEFGPPVTDPVKLNVPEATVTSGRLTSAIVNTDRFGNCVTNIPGEMCRSLGWKPGDQVQIATPGGSIAATFGTRYSDVPNGKEIVFINRLNLMELSINMGDFSTTYNVKTGAAIEIAPRG
ncbi:MAG: SAM-dependent chlorinase/fluorinase [Chloroflexi bacterium]|nr:SAM-dependent chlorinase/fluorinase [Chloroflexota bacterium]